MARMITTKTRRTIDAAMAAMAAKIALEALRESGDNARCCRWLWI
jgi:hypothetical protein